ncbi:Baculoviral IAP repeat-containing protein 5.2-B [Colletotrichum spinosum]|uniref:Baculoviral IAP repeat-containing protein 5.2-B n=1 Tax=Colletotrichum spinosum TaxID=1347390 RepID=A0A4V3HSF7_9PEZI|nr:Baculoviral IAP repeat-containing protein 5.2-B [Colletotrichum spinosum]
MKDFAARLATFHADGSGDRASDWPVAAIRREDMAGAGFVFTPAITKGGDAVACEVCGTQAWAWDAEDDPFVEHINGSPRCLFTGTKDFDDRHQDFIAWKEQNESASNLVTPPPTPGKKGKGGRKRKKALTPIWTVCDIHPTQASSATIVKQQSEQQGKDITISIMAGQTNVTIQVSDAEPRASKRIRLE